MATMHHAPLKPISNGPKAIHAQRVPAPDRDFSKTAPAKPSTSVARSCSQCRRPVPAGAAYKWCEVCRQKEREKAKKKKARALERSAQAAHASSVLAGGRELNEEIYDALGIVARDNDIQMSEADGVLGDGRADRSKKRTVSDAETDDLGFESTATTRIEFQAEEDLIHAFGERTRIFHTSRANSLSPAYVNLYGSFTIVMDPDVREERRVKRVIEQLKQSANLKLGDLVRRDSDKSRCGHARTYWCACNPPLKPPQPEFGSRPPALPMSTSNPPGATLSTPSSQPSLSQPSLASGTQVKRTQSTLARWLSQPKSARTRKESLDVIDLADDMPPPGCGGTITVYAMLDSSHPLASMGIKGQRIVVRVEHPGWDVNRDFQW